MSKEGIMFLKKYFSAEDSAVFEPLFIGQYLMIPVNTIVYNSLLPWMMTNIRPLSQKSTTEQKGGKLRARECKSEIFLRYELLKDIMNIVKKYGRNAEYNFKNDSKLSKIKEGDFGDKLSGDKTKNILAIDGFMTIWLITLPEKFQEWRNYHRSQNKITMSEKFFNYNEVPNFPTFDLNSNNSLHINSTSKQFLPSTWNLMICFEHYFNQEEFWSTKSIEIEIEPRKKGLKHTIESQTSTPCISPKSSENKKRENKSKNVDGQETDENVNVQDNDSENEANKMETSEAEGSLVEEKADVPKKDVPIPNITTVDSPAWNVPASSVPATAVDSPAWNVPASSVPATAVDSPASNIPASGVPATEDLASLDKFLGDVMRKEDKATRVARKNSEGSKSISTDEYTIPRRKRLSDPYIQEESKKPKKRTVSDEQASRLINEMGPKLTKCLWIAEQLHQAPSFYGNVKLKELMEELTDIMRKKEKLVIFAEERL